MLFATADQGWVFLVMCLAGAVTAAWYDLLRLLRVLLEAGPVLSLAVDAVFGLGAAALLGGAMLAANYGAPRLYMLPAAGLGALLYALGISRPLRRLLRTLGRHIPGMMTRLKDKSIIKVIFK